MRKTGILLSITSLPSKYGIGTLGEKAIEFIDFLKRCNQTYWQVLPIQPTSYGDSPYQTFSAFAGNPYFIDFDLLIKRNLLHQSDLDDYITSDDERYVDYKMVYENRFKILKKAYNRFVVDNNYYSFCDENSFWLEDYALFMAIKDHNNGASWLLWDEDIKRYNKEAVMLYKNKYVNEINFYKFLQYIFYEQFNYIKYYANSKGIKIIGDIPIYVALDSSDVWANKELFELRENCNPIEVAGCPPDAYATTGQLWGNPLYNWNKMEKNNYAWWIKRIKKSMQIYDVLRIDHFRGFDAYYAIKFEDQTAEFGVWREGPGIKLFNAIKSELGEVNIIAEDLGYLTPSVRQLLKDTTFPGMKVLQFGFSNDDSVNEYKPHYYESNSVAYTGTHDNQTTRQWLLELPNDVREKVYDYCNITCDEDAVISIIKVLQQSKSSITIVPIQDYLDLGLEARINVPSTVGLNWRWRLVNEDISHDLESTIRRITNLYNRN